MNRVASDNGRKWRMRHTMPERELGNLVELVLKLDRIVVELSMRIYNVSQEDRFLMRAHNRRLHNVVRKRLPGILARNPL